MEILLNVVKHLYKFILYILKYSSWPIIVLVIALIFKDSIVDILNRITTVKFGNLSAEISKKINETGSKVENTFPSTNHDDENTKNSFLSHLSSQNNSIISGWHSIETALKNAALRSGLKEGTTKTVEDYIHFLSSKKLLNKNQITSIRSMQSIRNQFVQTPYVLESIVASDMVIFDSTSSSIVDFLNKINN